MANTIKRDTNKMTIKTLVEFGGGKKPTPAGTIFELKKDFQGWHGGGFAWIVGHLRNSNIIEILKQERDPDL